MECNYLGDTRRHFREEFKMLGVIVLEDVLEHPGVANALDHAGAVA